MSDEFLPYSDLLNKSNQDSSIRGMIFVKDNSKIQEVKKIFDNAQYKNILLLFDSNEICFSTDASVEKQDLIKYQKASCFYLFSKI